MSGGLVGVERGLCALAVSKRERFGKVGEGENCEPRAKKAWGSCGFLLLYEQCGKAIRAGSSADAD